MPLPSALPAPRSGPKIGPPERLSATLALSLILFAVVILGVVFTRDDAAPVVPTLDVILTQTSTPNPPEHADFIAQASNAGGGDSNRALRPREPQLAEVPKPDPGVAPQHMTAQAPPPTLETPERMVTTIGASDRRAQVTPQTPTTEPMPLPTGRELMQQSVEMARLASEIAVDTAHYAKRPKVKQITASTQEYEYAAYMRAWVDKVERVGNLNLPQEIRSRGLSGRLILTVVVRRDGSVGDITISSPSGAKLLDDTAVRTVRLAQPFPPIPKTKEDIDELYITRTWDYSAGEVSTE
jgi:protein TonB